MSLFGKLSRGVKKNQQMCCLGLGVFLVGLYVLKAYYPNMLEAMTASAPTKRDDVGDNKKVIKYFHMDGCPHCVNFSPIYDAWTPPAGVAKQKIEQADMTEEEQAQGISGFPTISLYNVQPPDNNLVKSSAELTERTPDGLNSFVAMN
jgi:hypothetical protein